MRLEVSTIAVTGATGFLGRYIVRALQARGARVVGAVRDPGRVPGLRDQGVELRRCDLEDRDSLVASFRGADAVVSNAALFAIFNTRWEDHRRANLVGVENVLEACAAAGVARVVQVSSCAVYRDRGRGVVTEDHPHLERRHLNPFNAYLVSKALSEAKVWEVARARGLAVTAIRPCTLYGAFDPNATPLIERLARFPIVFRPVFARFPFVYAGDVAETLVEALVRDAPAGAAFNVAGPDVPTWRIVEAYGHAGGRVGRIRVPIPVPVKMVVDSSRAARDLGFRNRPFEDGWRETFALEGRG